MFAIKKKAGGNAQTDAAALQKLALTGVYFVALRALYMIAQTETVKNLLQ